MAIGRPFINLINLPEGFEDQRTQFLSLENDRDFMDEVEDLVKKKHIRNAEGRTYILESSRGRCRLHIASK